MSLNNQETNTPEVTVPEALAGEELLGKWGHRARTFCGTLSVMTVCIMSLVYVWTIHESINSGSGWPDRTSLAIMTCGPILMGWTFMSVNKILGMLLGAAKHTPSVRQRLESGYQAFKSPETPQPGYDATQPPKN